jgi:sigma-B regulation protein RsbU (phosphoserine phosphatase)
MKGPRSIRSQLLLAINTAMAILFCAFLFVDYYREIGERVQQRHFALEEEAKTLLPALSRIRPRGIDAVQEYVDEVCGQMQDAVSPGHHIAVRLHQTVLQAVAHHRASPEIFDAMETAARSPTHRAVFGEEELVVGSHCQADVTVYVSEYLTDIRQAARAQTLRRLPRILVLALVLAATVNLVFLRMAANPLRQLVNTVEEIAGGQLGAQAGPFSSQEFTSLADAINSMSSSLAKTDRHRREAMARAGRIQQQLLPKDVHVPGLTVAHLYQPAEEVAGDYYDVVRLPDGTPLLCIADVAGHGVPAAMSAMMLKAFLLHAIEQTTDPSQILSFVNHRLVTVCQMESLASMLVARYDPEATALEYASAGHETGLFFPARGPVRELPSTALMLGVVEDFRCDSETLQVTAGDRLLLVTDGVTEAFDPEENLFGRERLSRLLRRCRELSIAETVREIERALATHRGGREAADDATVLAVEFAVSRA